MSKVLKILTIVIYLYTIARTWILAYGIKFYISEFFSFKNLLYRSLGRSHKRFIEFHEGGQYNYLGK